MTLAADFLCIGKQTQQLMVRSHLFVGELNNVFELYIAILDLVPSYELADSTDDTIVPSVLLLVRAFQAHQIGEDLLVISDLTVDLARSD